MAPERGKVKSLLHIKSDESDHRFPMIILRGRDWHGTQSWPGVPIPSADWCKSLALNATRWAAINAAMLALRGDGRHQVSLDALIDTMRQTGRDMRTIHKETSLRGLAVNVVDC